MNWDQIENSWTAMTRRVRPDLAGLASSGDQALLLSPDVDDLERVAIEATEASTMQPLIAAPIQTA